MKRSLKDLLDFSVETKDGERIDIKDFLFDEESWMIRYIEADLGNIFRSQRVLIPQMLLKDARWEDKLFITDLTKHDIEAGPKSEGDIPLSRLHEEEINKHYNLIDYWTSFYPMPGFGVATGMVYPPRPIRVPSRMADEAGGTLRSFSEMKGYDIRAIDEKSGRVDDVLVDDEDWQIVYLIVDTSSWFPWSKKVILTIDMLDQISYFNKEARINLSSETINNAPEYDTSLPLTIEFERRLKEFYDQTSQFRKAS